MLAPLLWCFYDLVTLIFSDLIEMFGKETCLVFIEQASNLNSFLSGIVIPQNQGRIDQGV